MRFPGRAGVAVGVLRLAPEWGGVHDCGMPIRMKEWGVKAYPGQSVQVPLSGISGMGETARSFSRSLMAAGEGAAHLWEMREQVASQGEMAALHDGLQRVADKAQRELLDGREVENWEECWQQTVAPMVEPLLERVGAGRREAAMRTAQECLQQASVEAQRRYEVARISQARRQWESRVDEAVQRGDGKTAALRLEEGRDVFVPATEMDRQHELLQSRCCTAAWRSRLQEDPVGTVAAWRADDAQRPAADVDCRALESEMDEAGRSLRRQLGSEFARCVSEGLPPAPEAVAGAVSAGLLEPQKSARLRPLSQGEVADWMRRADECPNDEDSEAALQLRLATLSAPVQQRRRLLQYWESGRSVPVEARRDLNAELRALYATGAFGCAGDVVAQQRLCRLCGEGRRVLAEGDAEATSSWLASLRSKKASWLCFQD